MLVPVAALAGAATALTLVLRPSKRSRRSRRGRSAPPQHPAARPVGPPPLPPPPIPSALPALDLTLCRDALLAAITTQIALAPNATTLLRLAEAYAWVIEPGQAHGAAESS